MLSIAGKLGGPKRRADGLGLWLMRHIWLTYRLIVACIQLIEAVNFGSRLID